MRETEEDVSVAVAAAVLRWRGPGNWRERSGIPLVRRILPACVPAVANAPGHRYSSAAAAAAAAAATLPLILSDPPQPPRARPSCEPRARYHTHTDNTTDVFVYSCAYTTLAPLVYTPLAPGVVRGLALPLPFSTLFARSTLIAAAPPATYPLGPFPPSAARGNSDSSHWK